MNLKKGVLYVFISNFINMLIALFTGFILPKLLSVESYADIKLFQLYVSYVGILHLGYSDGMYLKYGGKTASSINQRNIQDDYITLRNMQLIVSIICIFLSITFNNKIFLFCSLTIFPINLANYIKYFYQATGEFKKYSVFTNVNTMLQFLINIVLLFIIKSDESNLYIIMYVVTYFIFLFIVTFEFHKFIKIRIFDLKIKYIMLRENIKTGFFLMIGNFGNIIFTSIDRLFVKELFGIVEFAYYSFAVSIDHLLSVFITPISTVMYNYFCNNKETEKILKVKKIVIVFSTILICLAFPAKFIVEVFIKKYIPSLDVLFILFASNMLTIIVKCIHINLYKSQKRQNRYFFIMVFIILLSVVFNYTCYDIWKNPLAIAYATLLVSFVWFVIGEVDLRKYKLNIKEYFYVFSLIIVFLFLGKQDNTIVSFLIFISYVYIMTKILFNDSYLYLKKLIIDYLKKILGRKRKK